MVCLYGDGDFVAVTTAKNLFGFCSSRANPSASRLPGMSDRDEHDEELQLAFEEYRNGTFIKHKKPTGK